MTFIKRVFFAIALMPCSIAALAEQGCPPGQYPIGGQGVAACAPIPQDGSTQAARPTGKWLKTWGAIASDGGDNLGVAKNKIKKSEAQKEALERCRSTSGKGCTVDFTYENQCASIAEPYVGNKSISGMLSYAGGASKDISSEGAISRCIKDNKDAKCRVIYSACSEPIFKAY
ncbi:DUF4189 domain-containing protein [Xanthomonas melonis]|uniref:DUF4189 domain-containing protein n=1 Tax=Xanthomonas melonis TaxID=56456 RepID=A0ABS8NRV9_9XANT|nr:DUF4189 domain-containing protein [Xanthomonas melonis]MCD0256758.1 DUF4189 domain-containing protein [Xanthomonas melonis]MCD0265030.1 DUF4189 domain-containing protein [Xanthomonas melonis]MCD0277439.1 DUF4189 domain-containing protein [Xanthomonas melonis]